MATLEEIGTDARTADGYVVTWSLDSRHDAVLAVPMTPPKAWSFGKLQRVLSSFTQAKYILGLKVDARTVGKRPVPTVYEISFAIPKGRDKLIELFLACAAQSNTIKNPIVTDMRGFSLK